jgi:uncharacterized membrane protein
VSLRGPPRGSLAEVATHHVMAIAQSQRHEAHESTNSGDVLVADVGLCMSSGGSNSLFEKAVVAKVSA